MFFGCLGLSLTDICRKVVYTDIRNIVLHYSLKYIINSYKYIICRAKQWTGFYMIGTSVMKEMIYLTYFNKFHCIEGNPGCLPRSKMGFFVRVVNSWKVLVSSSPISYLAGFLNPPFVVR